MNIKVAAFTVSEKSINIYMFVHLSFRVSSISPSDRVWSIDSDLRMHCCNSSRFSFDDMTMARQVVGLIMNHLADQADILDANRAPKDNQKLNH